MKTLKQITAFLFLIVCIGCAGSGADQNTPQKPLDVPTPTPTPAFTMVRQGSWGGTGILLQVRNEDSTFELDCAHGVINEPLITDSHAEFAADGTTTPEQGGPVHPGDPVVTYTTEFTGAATNDTMDLRIKYQAGDQTFDHIYHLKYNADPLLHKCL